MRLSQEEFMNALATKIGDDNSDENLKFLEDMTDTYNGLVSDTKDNTDWKAKYEQNDAEWRKKYRERFETPTPEKAIEENKEDLIYESSPRSFDELFTERK